VTPEVGRQRADDRAYRGSGYPGVRVDRRPGAADRVPARPPDRVRQRLSGAVWTALWESARRLPERTAFALADAAGALAHQRMEATRRRVRANLSRVVAPDVLDHTVEAAFRSYARYWVESFRAADLPADVVHDRTTTGGFEHLDAVLDEGRGAIVLLAHHGSWDVAARWAETHRYHLAVVAEVVRPAFLFARFVRLREAMGLEVVPLLPKKGVSNRGVAGRLREVLEHNHLVGLLSDRDLSGTAPRVDFFGAPCHIPIGPVALARRTGAPVVPITMLQRPGLGWHLQVLAPRRIADRDTRDGHRAVAAALEELILLDPTQWHAFQPIWPDDVAAAASTEAPRSPRASRP
jgi:KDO2-lipid IV(A) lauroyltransferase